MRLASVLGGFLAPAVCEICGRELAVGERMLCLHCIDSRPAVTTHAVANIRAERFPRNMPIAGVYPYITYRHHHPWSQLIRRGKYNDRPDLLRHLAALHGRALAAQGLTAGIDCLVPVPMHWLKRMTRGYNQAQVIAEAIGRETALPVVEMLAMRTLHRTQTRRDLESRIDNVAGSFKLHGSRSPRGLHIGLVDDILTSGATLTEAARTLIEAGASKITVLPLCATD